MTKKPDFVLRTVIRTTPDRLWEALLSGEISRHYYFNTRVEGRAAPGETLFWRDEDGAPMIEAEVIEAEPYKLLNMTFKPLWAGPDAPVSRHVFRIEPAGESCLLTLEHYDLPEAMQGVRQGWMLILSGLKTYLETGESLGVSMDMLSA